MGLFRDELEFHLQGGHTAEEIQAHKARQAQKRAEMMSGITNMAMQRQAAKEMGAYTSAGVSSTTKRERNAEGVMREDDSEQMANDVERQAHDMERQARDAEAQSRDFDKRSRDLAEKAAEMHEYAAEIRAQGKRQRERDMRFIREAYGDGPSPF